MSLPRPHQPYTPDEYLHFERDSSERHEYLDGAVYAMAGESLEHSTIGSNINAILNYQLRGKPCRVLQPNMKVYARSDTDQSSSSLTGLFAYPDCTVVCGAPVFHDSHRDVLINPTVIVEILSKSTEAYDRGEKFARYAQLASFTDYILVSQSRPRIEHWTRQPGNDWLMHAEDGLSGNLLIRSIECALALAEVYDRIEFPRGSAPVAPVEP